jgi:rubredoxin
MAKYICDPCQWIYDEEKGDSEGGIAPGTEFKDLPYDWVCPLCGFGVEVFTRIE